MRKSVFIFLLASFNLWSQSSPPTNDDSCAFMHAHNLWSPTYIADDSVDLFFDELDIVGWSPGLLSANWDVGYEVKSKPTSKFAYVRKNRTNGKRLIYYDSVRLSNMRRLTGTEWSLRFVAAHEFAHFSVGHFEDNTDTWTKKEEEIQADEMAAQILASMGAPDTSVMAGAIRLIAHEQSKQGYPTRKERLEAIANGWQKYLDRPTKSIMFAFQSANRKVLFNVEETIWVADESWQPVFGIKKSQLKKIKVRRVKSGLFIRAGELAFHNYDTGQEYVLGSVYPSTRAGYRHMVIDDYYNFWYIDEANRVTDMTGKEIGTLAQR